MKKRLRLTTISKLPAGSRFWFARGHLCGAEGTVIFQATRIIESTCWHFGHEYNQEASRFISQKWRSVWVEVQQ